MALALAACVLGGCVLAGCGGGRSGSHSMKASAAAAAPQPSARCGTPDMRAVTVRFRAGDGAELDGALVGSGPAGVVLLHEYPGPMCGWWPYAAYLAHQGMHAMLFDFGCLGLSSCPGGGRTADPSAEAAAAMSVLRSHGARSIALVGASLGGVASVMAGAQNGPSAVVDLSGERDLSGLFPGTRLNSLSPAAALRAPALFVVARDDRYVSVADMRAVYRRAGSRVKRLIVLPASAGHGWDMLLGTGGRWSPLAGEVAAFVRAHASIEPIVDGCLRLAPGDRAIVLHPHGASVPAALVGGGTTTFVLSNESDENLCSWLPFVAALRAHGYSALLYDYLDPTQLPSEAIAGARAARAAGARHVVLMGASVGARASIAAAARSVPGVSAVVSLSAERTVASDPRDLVVRARQVMVPSLLISARDDPFVSGATSALLRAVAGRPKRAVILPGTDHGTALLGGRSGRRVQSAIFAFVR